MHDQYLLESYPKLGGQLRITYAVAAITYAVAAIFIFARFTKDILGVTCFSVEKRYNSSITLLIRNVSVATRRISSDV